MKLSKFSKLTAAILATILSISMTSCDDDDETPVTPSLECDPAQVEIEIGETATVTINGGVAPFTVKSSDEEIATAEAEDNTVAITGVNDGTASVYISDANGIAGIVAVTVKEASSELVFDNNSVTLGVGENTSVTVSGGTEPYTLTVGDENIATATIEGGIVNIIGVAAGSTTINITDQDDKTGSISVIITE